jgi:hypothetical protein
LNAILPGPLHTLHLHDGSLVDPFWYEPKALVTSEIYRPDKEWTHVQRRAASILSRLRSIKYRADIEAALVRYSRAFDNHDLNAAFSGLWGVLEFLTDSVGAYEQLISRAAFVIADKDRDFVRLLLEHLRDVRNGLIHEDRERTNVESYLYQLKWLAEVLLRFHLRNGALFASRSEAARYLDLSLNRDTLRLRIKEYRRALRQRG